MATTFHYDWEANAFWKDLTNQIHRHEAEALSGLPCQYDEHSQNWWQPAVDAASTLPALLQNKFAAVDVTDHGMGLYPILLDGRYFLRVNFRIDDGRSTWNTHDLGGVVERQVSFPPGTLLLTGTTENGATYTVSTFLPQSAPLVVIEVIIRMDQPLGSLSITPEIVWMPGPRPAQVLDDFLWLKPCETPSFDAVEIRNDSLAADPLRPDGLAKAGVAAALVDFTGGIRDFTRAPLVGEDNMVIADRRFSADVLERITLPALPVKTTGQLARFGMVLGLCDTPAGFRAEFDRWLSQRAGDALPESDYWETVLSRLTLSVPDLSIRRQARCSVHNSLFSRSTTTGGRTLFIHGRRDRGYADCAKMHQTYQLHYVALAANETRSVREELISFAAVQDPDGGLPRQLSPRSGWHTYIGTYSNANFLLAIYRYLSWTGDDAFLAEPIESEREPGVRRTLLDRALLAAGWLLGHRWQGLVEPCGWVDAWAKGVKANSQASMAAAMSLRRLVKICQRVNRDADALWLDQFADEIEKRTKEVFYNPRNGLFAEYLYEDGSLAGGELNDFWSITQIWAVLAGIAPDIRGLDLTRQYCLKRGIVMNPEEVVEAAFLSQLQDTLDPLPLDRNAVWGLAAWPELTHLYALAEVRAGRPDLALDAVSRTLPEKVHRENAYAAPFFYPEKYIAPLTTPWLCTWAGDPTLIQLLLEGFFGLQVNMDGVTVEPHLPSAWQGSGPLRARFCYHGSQMELVVDPSVPGSENITLRQV